VIRAAALALALVACHQQQSPPPEQAVGACLGALTQAPRPDADHAPRACTRLARDPACRAALEAPLGRELDAWSAAMISACAPAYCGVLSPKPRACVTLADPDAAQELFGEIILHDTGLTDPAQVAVVRRAFTPVTLHVARAARAAPPDAGAGCDETIVVAVGAAGAAVESPEASAAIAPCGTSLDHTALALALCDAIHAARCAPQVVIQAEHGVRHGDVIELMDLAKSAGVAKLALGMIDRVTPGPHLATARCDQPTPTTCP
jgi:hypothetical protein